MPERDHTSTKNSDKSRPLPDFSTLAASIPAELKALHRWVAWKFEIRGGRLQKVPYSAGARRGRADVTNSANWGTFDAAVQQSMEAKLSGIGFVFANDGIVGVDLDKCRDPETDEIEDWAMAIVKSLNSYTEISISGTGVHILVRGALPVGWRRKERLEIYNAGRYFVMTGAHLEGSSKRIEERSTELVVLHREFARSGSTASKPQVLRPASTPSTPPIADVNDDDLSVLMRARQAANGPKFSRLWAGDTFDYDGDHSRADVALCTLLAFWTKGNRGQIDRLFRQSGLMRSKWADRADYREMTITRAIDNLASRRFDDIGEPDIQRPFKIAWGAIPVSTTAIPTVLVDTDEVTARCTQITRSHFRQWDQDKFIFGFAVINPPTSRGALVPLFVHYVASWDAVPTKAKLFRLAAASLGRLPSQAEIIPETFLGGTFRCSVGVTGEAPAEYSVIDSIIERVQL